MEKNKQNTNNKSMTILCTFLIIVIIGLVGFIGFTLGSKTTTLPKEEQQEESKEETSNEEVEFNDYKTIKDLSIKIDRLLGANKTKEFNLSQTYGMYSFRSGLLKNKLTKEDKQLIALQTVEWDSITGDAWKNYDKMKNIVLAMAGSDEKMQQDYLSYSNQISADKLDEYSIKLFGEKIENPIEELGKCPLFYYDSVSKNYFRPNAACGGTSAHYAKSYKSKFTKKDDEVYVYISIAYLEQSYNDSFIVYKDIDNVTSLSLGNTTFKDRYTLEDTIYNEKFFTINENNYQHFSEYKFKFKKDTNDNYYFVDIEQTK